MIFPQLTTEGSRPANLGEICRMLLLALISSKVENAEILKKCSLTRMGICLTKKDVSMNYA